MIYYLSYFIVYPSQRRERGRMRLHMLNNVNRVIQTLEEFHVSIPACFCPSIENRLSSSNKTPSNSRQFPICIYHCFQNFLGTYSFCNQYNIFYFGINLLSKSLKIQKLFLRFHLNSSQNPLFHLLLFGVFYLV